MPPQTPPDGLSHFIRNFPFLGKVPHLTARQWRVFELLVLIAIFGNYGEALLQSTLPLVRDSLGADNAQLSNMIAATRVGTVLALGIMFAADRIGRRRTMLLCFYGTAIATGASAFAFSPSSFIALQLLVRMFSTAEALLAGIIMAEEFPVTERGWGIGARLLVGGFGVALSALAFSLVDVLPFGWRTLYLLGFGALYYAPRIVSGLPETDAYLQRQSQRKSMPSTAGFSTIFGPFVSIVTAYPGRFGLLALIAFLLSFGTTAAFFFDLTYLQDEHQWRPWMISALTLFFGFAAVASSSYVGRYTDRAGRKRSGILFLLILPLCVVGFYSLPVFLAPFLWAAIILASRGIDIALGALSSELFPTSYRATAKGGISLFAAFGSILGLATHGLLSNWLGSLWSAAGFQSLVVLSVPLLIYLLPETSGRALEEIAPEKN